MAKKDFNQLALDQAKINGGKLSVEPKVPIETRDDLSIAYTPGVGAVSSAIAKDQSLVYDLTTKKNTVAVVSDGSAVLGLGNIGAEAAMPVMEGKAALFKRFAKVDAVPIVLDTQDTEAIIAAVKAIAPTFGGINLEDISAPRCFEIETRLIDELNIPVFHDDQHGTAIVVLAALYNALKVADKKIEDIRVVVNGGGSAGLSVARRFLAAGVKHIIVVDKVGILAEKNADQLPPHHAAIAKITNRENRTGTLEDALKGADVFIGVSAPHILNRRGSKQWRPNRLFSPWPIRNRRFSRMKRWRLVRILSELGAVILQTRSTMCSLSQAFSAALWMLGHAKLQLTCRLPRLKELPA